MIFGEVKRMSFEFWQDLRGLPKHLSAPWYTGQYARHGWERFSVEPARGNSAKLKLGGTFVKAMTAYDSYDLSNNWTWEEAEKLPEYVK